MIRTQSPVMSANSVKRSRNWVRRPLHSGPLSTLITSCFKPPSSSFLSSHQKRSPSTMKSLVLWLVPKNKNALPVTDSRMQPGTIFFLGHIS